MDDPKIEIAKLKTNETNMSKQISDIKDDIKDVKEDIGGIKSDIVGLKIVIARWGAGIFVGWTLIEIGIKFILE
jgi:ABC-type Fe3+-hydroxamate transport system substrate-binding protein